jgi:putative colanic acid biosynthesis glycosyltransferase
MNGIGQQPCFSVVTIAFNDLAGLQETHASIAAQTSTDFEWIVIDGGSNDGTVEYLRTLDLPNCRWSSEPDLGLYDAMNKGLDRAVGEYVIFMNSGDRFCTGEVLAHISTLLTEGRDRWDLLFGDAFEQTAGGKLLLKRARGVSTINYGMFTHHQAMLYRIAAVRNMHYNRRFVIAADYEFTCRLLKAGGESLYVGFPVSVNKRAGLSEQKAATGRRENLIVQKQTLRLSLIRRVCNYTLFLISSLVRAHMRGLYDRVRFHQRVPVGEPR